MSSVLPNPFVLPEIPTESERRAARKALGLPLEFKVVSNAGWSIPTKRFDVFLRVAARVLAVWPDMVFVIAGDGPERTRLADLAHELRIERQVRFMGWQEDLGNFFK